MFAPQDAPIILIFGQSNAHGHSLAMKPEDRITVPMERVLTLRQENDLHFGNTAPVWSGYTSRGSNLGETQDDTYCIAGELAKMWEAGGLPPLRLIRISIGAEGVTEKYMWHPDYERVLIPGPLGTAKMALYPLACSVLRRVTDDLKRQGKTPRILALHWLGGEEETALLPEELTGLEELYHRIIGGFFEAAGQRFPIRFYKLLCRRRVASTGESVESLDLINDTFRKLAEHYPGSAVVSAENAPFWDESDPCYGIFEPDGGHYTARTQRWFAEKAFAEPELYR